MFRHLAKMMIYEVEKKKIGWVVVVIGRLIVTRRRWWWSDSDGCWGWRRWAAHPPGPPPTFTLTHCKPAYTPNCKVFYSYLCNLVCNYLFIYIQGRSFRLVCVCVLAHVVDMPVAVLTVALKDICQHNHISFNLLSIFPALRRLFILYITKTHFSYFSLSITSKRSLSPVSFTWRLYTPLNNLGSNNLCGQQYGQLSRPPKKTLSPPSLWCHVLCPLGRVGRPVSASCVPMALRDGGFSSTCLLSSVTLNSLA